MACKILVISNCLNFYEQKTKIEMYHMNAYSVTFTKSNYSITFPRFNRNNFSYGLRCSIGNINLDFYDKIFFFVDNVYFCEDLISNVIGNINDTSTKCYIFQLAELENSYIPEPSCCCGESEYNISNVEIRICNIKLNEFEIYKFIENFDQLQNQQIRSGTINRTESIYILPTPSAPELPIPMAVAVVVGNKI